MKKLVLIALALCWMMTTISAAQEWNEHVVDYGYEVGVNSDMACDAEGNPYIVYYNSNTCTVRYSRWDGLGWVSEIVADYDDTTIEHSAIAVDSTGNVHIAFIKSDPYEIIYAVKENAEWVLSTVPDQTVSSSAEVKIDVVGEQSTPHIICVSLDFEHYYYQNGAWNEQIIDPLNGNNNCDMVSDSNGNLYVSYQHSRYLKLAFYDGVTWNLYIIDDGIDDGQYANNKGTSITLDADNVPHISYHDNINQTLKHATLSPQAMQVLRQKTEKQKTESQN